MVDEALSTGFATPRLRIEPWIMEGAFLALLLLAFVGLSPFALRNVAALAPGASSSGAGDAMRQACYLLVFAIIVGDALWNRGLGVVMAVPPMLVALLAWCLASAYWAAEPDVALRRAALEIVVVLSVLLCVDTIGTERAFRIWWFVLAAVLVVDWLSIPLIHQAVHLPGEQDSRLVGDWRGLYFHKNIAGAVAALSAIVFFFSALRTRRWLDIALCLAAIGFTVMTRSKSSLGLLLVALLFGLVYRFAWRSNIDRMIAAVATGLFLLVAVAYVFLNSEMIARALEDPAEFTGRGAIWQAEIAFVRDHPLLGSGFGTFADTGNLSPLHNYVGAAWVETVAHGHNGYLQLLVTIGGIGFAFALIGLIAVPASRFWRLDDGDPNLRAMLFTLFVFLLLHNFMESDFLESDGPAWVAFLLMLAMLRAPPARQLP